MLAVRSCRIGRLPARYTSGLLDVIPPLTGMVELCYPSWRKGRPASGWRGLVLVWGRSGLAVSGAGTIVWVRGSVSRVDGC